jgi:polyisoprenoid-binding protein YceI
MKVKLGLAAILLAVFAMGVYAATWNVDPSHTNVQFSVRHMMVTPVRGNFGSFSGSAVFDEKVPQTLSFEGAVDATSINTNNERRDAHLKSADFFDVANYPKITFTSTKSEMVAPGKYRVTGDLTMRGVKKEVVMDLEGLTDFIAGPKGGVRTGASLSTTINRHDFGLNWNKTLEAGGVLVGDSVKINLDVELEKAQEQNTPAKQAG